MPPADRKSLLQYVRSILTNTSATTFLTGPASVQVLPGNQQAAFTWTAVNLEGTDTLSQSSTTVGSVHLGDESSQIAFVQPPEGVLEGSYRLQVGSSLSWDLYSHSYSGAGFNSVKKSHLSGAADAACRELSSEASAVVPRFLEYCFFAGYSESVTCSKANSRRPVEIHGPPVPASDQLYRCVGSLQDRLSTRHADERCQELFGHKECGMQGSYQPQLPRGPEGHFVGSGLFQYSWQLLKLGTESAVTLGKVRGRAETLCAMSFSDLVMYDAGLIDVNKNEKHNELLPYSCFLTSYMLVLLQSMSMTHAC